MFEFVVIVESSADAQTATKLAERVLVEKLDWLEPESLQDLFRWSGLQDKADYSCWKNIRQIVYESERNLGYKPPRTLRRNQPLKADGAAAIKVLNLIRFLQKNRQIRAVLLIRDLDNQPERRDGLEQARVEHIARQPKLEIVIGTANRMREAWVLNGFLPADRKEESILDNIKNRLTFDPCEEPHRLRSNSWDEPERVRNPKVVLEQLTNNDKSREQQCWEETSLPVLQQRGKNTGLTAYLQEVEQRLIPVILE